MFIGKKSDLSQSPLKGGNLPVESGNIQAVVGLSMAFPLSFPSIILEMFMLDE
jgi:hypothetical protein